MQFKPGFRFSILDAFILAAALVLAVFLSYIGRNYAILVGFVVLHFFLFCNLVRMSRIPEIIWSVVFLCLFYCHLNFSTPSFKLALLISLVLTVVLVFIEIHKPSYHGIGWKRINPKLPEWFSMNQKRSD